MTNLIFQAPKLKRGNVTDPEESTLNWSSRRLGILNRFTTNEKLSLSTSFLCTSSAEGGGENCKFILLLETIIS